MNLATRVRRLPPRAWLPAARTARTATSITATAVLALAGAAPSSALAGGSSNALSHSTHIQKALAYSRCMRSHGVAAFPDPSSSGVIAKETPQQLGISSSQLQAAENHCRQLLPNGDSGPTPAALAQSWNEFLNFAQCMRRHGVPNWPDPTRYPQHPDRPYFDLAASIDLNSPQISSKIHACLPLLHGTNPQHLG